MTKGRWTALVVSAGLFLALFAGEARAERPRIYVISGAKLLVAPGTTVDEGTIVLRDGLIESAGAKVEPPSDAVVIDGKGKVVHAGFIDACSTVGRPDAEGGPGGRAAGGPPSSRGAAPETGAAHPISKVRPEHRMLDRLRITEKDTASHREMGFTAALVVPDAGIFRGTSALVALGEGPVADLVIRPDVAQHVSFERGRFRQPYPTSLMGALAAIRQGFLDATQHAVWSRRYAEDPSGMRRPGTLSAWDPLAEAASGAIPVVFEMESPRDALRAMALAREFSLKAMLVGSGSDHEIAADLAAAGVPVLLPLSFPEKPDMDDEGATLEVETEDLRRFLGARSNASVLAGAGVTFALGTCGLKKRGDFAANLRAAVEEGLSSEAALAALTSVPARLFGVEGSMGSLEPGKAASLVVRTGDPFSADTKVVDVFVDGVEYPVEEKKKPEGKGEGGGRGGSRRPDEAGHAGREGGAR